MSFAIAAQFSLGTYRGALGDGSVERLASVARLYSALLNAAGCGTRAELVGGRLRPCQQDTQALLWLEQNPPDNLGVPDHYVNLSLALAYRDDGTFDTRPGKIRVVRKIGKRSEPVAYAGELVWSWSIEPPAEVADALCELCADVAYLGTSESPVRLYACRESCHPLTHSLDPDANLFDRSGEDVELPLPGRLDELLTAHERATGKAPTVARDAVKAKEEALCPHPPRQRLALARYSPLKASSPDVPWPQVLVLPVESRTRGQRESALMIAEDERVAWAVAAHRALIAKVGEDVPPLITGVAPAGVRRPANGLSLQFIDRGMPVGDLLGDAQSALAIMIPNAAEPAALGVLFDAVGDLRSVRRAKDDILRFTGDVLSVSGARFWPAPAPFTARLWRTAVRALPDTRGHGARWTFADAALLSLAFVWKDFLPAPSGRGGEQRNRQLVRSVAELGVVPVAAAPLRTGAVERYAHTINPHAIVRPYHITLALGDLGGGRALQAIGQSRHLGGGLLVPYDLPSDDTSPGATSATNCERDHGAGTI